MKRPLQQLLTRGYQILDFFVQKPSRGLVLLMGLQVLGWGMMGIFVNPIPPFDMVVLSYFVREFGFGAAELRNPPLVNMVYYLLGSGDMPPFPAHYIITQLFVIATYGAVYAMGVVLLKNKMQALVATLLLTGLDPYNRYSLVGLNHNTIQYPFWALIPLLTFYATRPLTQKAHQHRWWLLLGFVMGVSLWAKYSIALLLATVGLWVLIDKEARAHLATPYPYGALLIFLCVAAIPLEQAWQNSHAIENHLRWWDRDENVWSNVINKPKLMLLAVLLAGLVSWRTRLTYPFHHMTKRDTHFLCLFALMPFIILFLITLIIPVNMIFHWLSPMYPLWGIVLVALVRAGWRKYSAHVILVLAVALLLKPVYQYPFERGFYPRFNNSQVIVGKIIDRWRQQTSNQPLYHVFGNIGQLAGVVALYAGNEVRLIHQYNKAADDELLQKQGVLFVFDGKHWFSDEVRQKIARFNLKEQSMKIDEYPHVIYYAILPPAEK